jgi:hypothetical protein
MGRSPKLPNEIKFDYLSLLRSFNTELLNSHGLLPEQIEKQSLDELENSLNEVNELIQHSDEFGKLKLKLNPEIGPVVVTQGSDYHYEVNILPLFLEVKKLILNRKKSLTSDQKIENLKNVVNNNANPDELQDEIKSELNSDDIKQIDIELKRTEELQLSAEVKGLLLMKKAEDDHLKLKSDILKSFLEKESVATIIGAFLLLFIAFSEVFFNYLNIKPSDVVNNAFLLILGYFFGQSISKGKNN